MSRKQIMVLRHAKAEADSPRGDFGRNLSPTGREQAGQIGKELLSLKLLPQVIISSTAKRAKQTAERVCDELAIDSTHIQLKEDLYEATHDAWVEQCHRLNNRLNRVLLVGHNPALEDLVDYLSKADFESDQGNGKRMMPATLIVLEFEGDWMQLAEHSCAVTRRLHGKLLTD